MTQTSGPGQKEMTQTLVPEENDTDISESAGNDS